ncbi:MAG: MerR family transcriptional regulator [Clostridia bacterium]
MSSSTYSISEIAKMLHITRRTLRFYDQIGLLTPSSFSPGGHRYYTEEEIEKLYKIRLLKSLGLNLKQIRLMFEETDLKWEDLLDQQLDDIEAQLKKYRMMQEIILIVQRSIKLEGKMDWNNLFRYLKLLYEDNHDSKQHLLKTLFTDEELDFLERMLPRMKSDDPVAREMIDVFAQIRECYENEDCTSEKVQKLAARIEKASNKIFEGRDELQEKVWRIQKEAPELLMQYPVDPQLMQYIEDALIYYRQSQK